MQDLNVLNERELLEYCNASSTANEKCDDEFFRVRFSKLHPEEMKYKPGNLTWREYYLEQIYYKDKLFREFRNEYGVEDPIASAKQYYKWEKERFRGPQLPRMNDSWVDKIKKNYPRVPVEKIEDPKTLYRKLVNIKPEYAQWEFWNALKLRDNDLINSLPYIYEVTYPNVIITDGDKWKFFDTSLKRDLVFEEGLSPHQVNVYTLLKMIVDNGAPIERYYLHSKFLDQARKEGDISTLLHLIRLQHTSPSDLHIHIQLTEILYNYLKEKGQIYPSGTPFNKIYVK